MIIMVIIDVFKPEHKKHNNNWTIKTLSSAMEKNLNTMNIFKYMIKI